MGHGELDMTGLDGKAEFPSSLVGVFEEYEEYGRNEKRADDLSVDIIQ